MTDAQNMLTQASWSKIHFIKHSHLVVSKLLLCPIYADGITEFKDLLQSSLHDQQMPLTTMLLQFMDKGLILVC